MIFTKYQNSTLRTIKLTNIQESNPKNKVFKSIYHNRVITKEGNLFKENLPKNASELTTGATDRRGHDGKSRPSVVPYLTPFPASLFTNFLLPSTDMDDDPLHARRSIDVFRSSILRIFWRWVLGLLSINIDGCTGWSIVAMTVRGEPP